jgi:hypothetical protein
MNSISSWDADKFKEDIGFLIVSFNSMFLCDIYSLLINPNGDRKKSMRGLISLDVAKIQRDLHEVIKDMWGQCKLYLNTIHLLIPRPTFRPFALNDLCPFLS